MLYKNVTAIAALLFALFSACESKQRRGETHCGVERWAIKDLNDRRATEIKFTPEHRTVGELVGLPVVVPTRNEERRDDELQVYRVECEIVKYKLEDDGDIHLVIQDPDHPSEHMVAEIPDPDCPDAKEGGHSEKFREARKILLEILGDHAPNSRMQAIEPPPKVELTGVGFYDFPHHQTGAAANDLEIHPVLTVKASKR